MRYLGVLIKKTHPVYKNIENILIKNVCLHFKYFPSFSDWYYVRYLILINFILTETFF